MNLGIGSDRIVYLYGVMPTHQLLPSCVAPPLRRVSHGSVTALVEPVCAHEFGSDALVEKLQSIDWVARQARRHEAVLEQAMRHGPIVPARLCTLFSGSAALECSLARNEARFLATLARIEDKEEWGLKAFSDESRLRAAARAQAPELAALEAAIEAASPGHAFVLRKKREAQLAQLALGYLDALTDELLFGIEQIADDVCLRDVLSAPLTGRDAPLVLNAATLVNVSHREALLASVDALYERYAAAGLAIELSGPWPPYSFCAVPEESDAAAPPIAATDRRA